MKRPLSAALAAILILVMLVGCSLVPTQSCTVNFYINGESYAQKSVALGSSASMPISPDRDGYIFAGWYLDPDYKTVYDFSTPVLFGTALYGRFVPDAEEVTRLINDSVMSTIVTVHNKSYNTTFGGFMETEALTSQGSGVVIDISGGYCYVLTNCHVVEKNEKYSNQKITVEDAWGNSYEAKLYQHPSLTESAKSAKYDLALLCFKYNTEGGKLTEILLGEDPKVGEYLASVGAPENKKNTVVFGEIWEYRDLSDDENSNFTEMDFDVILHAAALGHGSSGGAVVDMTGKLVGINFAGVENSSWGFAIPISVVHEFLNIYVYNNQQ